MNSREDKSLTDGAVRGLRVILTDAAEFFSVASGSWCYLALRGQYKTLTYWIGIKGAA